MPKEILTLERAKLLLNGFRTDFDGVTTYWHGAGRVYAMGWRNGERFTLTIPVGDDYEPASFTGDEARQIFAHCGLIPKT